MDRVSFVCSRANDCLRESYLSISSPVRDAIASGRLTHEATSMGFPTRLRFGVFEMDLQAGELRKQGVKLKLQDQPFQILAAMIQKQGEIVTREDLRQRLGASDAFGDFDHLVNKAVNKIREVLGDASDSPRFVETLPRRGYRFLAPVESIDPVEPRPNAPQREASTPAKRRLGREAVAWICAGGSVPRCSRICGCVSPREARRIASDAVSDSIATPNDA